MILLTFCSFSSSCRRSIGIAVLAAAAATPLRAQSANADLPPPRPWWERITFGGDFRSRYEGFFQDEAEARHRQRFRLRLTMRAPITEAVRFGLRLATGEPSDLTSTNQSLSDLLSRKAINIDQATLTWSPTSLLAFGAGKFGYPITRTQLTWDDDLNWEGAWERVRWELPPASTITLTAVQSPLFEVSGGDDAFLYAWSGELALQAGGHQLQFTVSNYEFREVDLVARQVAARGLRNAITNRVVRDSAGAVTGYQSGFNLVDIIAQATIDIGVRDYPLTLLADRVTNTRAAENDGTGVWLQARLGRASRPGTAVAGYTFARIERDAVVSTFNFSDIAPTNVRMHLLTVSYAPVDRLALDATAIFTSPLEGPDEPLLTRLQIDARVTF